MVDARHLNGTTGESKSYTVTNNGTALGATLDLSTKPSDGVEFVPVVRCKDCRYRDDTQWCEWMTRYIRSDGFCAWGERREEKND